MQLNVQELIEFASTLPPQFADMQPEQQRPEPQSVAAPDSQARDAQRGAAVQPVVQQHQTERERMVQSLAKEYRGKSRSEILGSLGPGLGAEVGDAMQSQEPTARGVFTKYQQQEREAKRELGKGLVALGVEVQHHSVKDYTHVVLTQMNLFQGGVIPSVSTVLNAAFPDDPKKATSIGNSQNGKRYKQAWGTPAVKTHLMEKAMHSIHNRHDMNRRLTARTFGQSLGMNATLFKNSDRITKLEARVQLLEQQMQSTKTREALADAGCSTSREKVLALSSQGKGPTEIARELGMNRDTVRKALQRARKAA